MPFSERQFLQVFARYNEAVWPAQFALILVAIAAVTFALSSRRGARRLSLVCLAALWGWTGVVYHLTFFTAINPAAYLFAALFVANAAVIFWIAIGPLADADRTPARFLTMALLLLYALAGYPLVGYLAGLRYPAVPTFALPCPLTIFSFGLLGLFKVPGAAFVIPSLWALIGSVAAFRLHVAPDYVLLPAAAIALWTIRTKTSASIANPPPDPAVRT